MCVGFVGEVLMGVNQKDESGGMEGEGGIWRIHHLPLFFCNLVISGVTNEARRWYADGGCWWQPDVRCQ